MPWNDLIDQDRVVESLRRALVSERVAHAYLFHGPDGVGKTATALAFAQALLCERHTDDACGTCLACTKVQRLIHPDVQVLFPQPKDAKPEDVAERLQHLASNPYSTVDFARRPFLNEAEKSSNKQVQYHVKRVHEDLHGRVGYRPAEGRYIVAIVTDADLMRTEAANAFLKLLEEPAPETIFVLTTSRVDRVLPTIISRCQRLRFDLLEAGQIEQTLVARENVDPTRAAILARMAGGSYTRALDLATGEDLHEHRLLIVDYMRQSYARNVSGLAKVIDRMAAMSRERVKNLMPLIETWIRDLVLYRTLGDEAPLVNVDQSEVISKFCNNLPDARLDDMVSLIEEARLLVERNVNVGLLLTALSIRLSAAMSGKTADRLYLPLPESARGAA